MGSKELRKQEKSVNVIYQRFPDHVIFVHDKLLKRKLDRYMMTMAHGFNIVGSKVTVMTSYYEKDNTVDYNRFLDQMNIWCSGSWFPRSICGLFKQKLADFKAAWMAFQLIMFPPNPPPKLVILDVSPLALWILSKLTNYKLFYIENFLPLKVRNRCTIDSRMHPGLFDASFIGLADEIIVESHGFAAILGKSYSPAIEKMRILYPALDLSLEMAPRISVGRIVPDLLENPIIFLSVGKYVRSSNFKLSIDAFDLLITVIDDVPVTKRFHLIIAGWCRTEKEDKYYNSLLDTAKRRRCASQITFLRELPLVHEKSLLIDTYMVIHPAQYDVQSEFLLRAMCMGKTIIACDTGIAGAILVNKISGLLLPPDYKLFTLAIRKLLTTSHLHAFLGEMAKEQFRREFSFRSLCRKLKKLITPEQRFPAAKSHSAIKLDRKKNFKQMVKRQDMLMEREIMKSKGRARRE